MKYSKYILVSIFWVVLGTALLVCHLAGLVEEFWFSMGTGLLFVGILQSIKHIRYWSNESYREKIDTQNNDERNRFISSKAWAWAGWMFVMISAAGIIVFKLMDREDLMMMASGNVCILFALRGVSYMILKKKY